MFGMRRREFITQDDKPTTGCSILVPRKAAFGDGKSTLARRLFTLKLPA
jgi:hypothetical protein